ncbi:hypothetical protein ACG2K1_02510 [Neisseria sp. 23W00296]|uniref:hypothetical protein n=1 Tax=Neisseria sp. 23W00296 TaxID=3373603 RepID=UPI00383BB2DA
MALLTQYFSGYCGTRVCGLSEPENTRPDVLSDRLSVRDAPILTRLPRLAICGIKSCRTCPAFLTKNPEKSCNKGKKSDFFCCLTRRICFLHSTRLAYQAAWFSKSGNSLFQINKAKVRAIIQKPKSGVLKARTPLFFATAPKAKGKDLRLRGKGFKGKSQKTLKANGLLFFE